MKLQLHRRALLAGAAGVAACATSTRPELSPAPRDIGARAAAAYIARADIMMYDAPQAKGVHYAEAATAYGLSRFAAVTQDAALLQALAAREARANVANAVNTANHVDVNVYGVWPLELWMKLGDGEAKARGLAFADGQWTDLADDGLTIQRRYWIDDVWMIGALQVEAFRATGEPKYLDRAAKMARAYLARLQQPNGLFHHGEGAPFFWGRGNGWVASGLAEILTELPESHPDHADISAGFTRMMDALVSMQGEDGMWRQLIDHPDAWPESSCTAMFGFSMTRAHQRGVLRGHRYENAARRAWTALSAYVQDDGLVREVCVGTGKSDDEAYYYARPRVTGDLHGQAPLLWFASALLEA